MSTLRTYNLQNPDSSNVNIELTQGSGAVVAGVATFSSNVTVSGNLTVDGVLTYDDVTNIDSVGIITARDGLHVTGGKVSVGSNNPSGNLNISYLQVGKGQVSSDHSLYNYNTSFTNNAYQNGNGTFAHITSRPVGVINLQDNVLTFSNGPGGTAGQSATLTERLRIKSDGKVGIGTVNPSKPLQVHDDTAAAVLITGPSPQIRLNSNVTDGSDNDRAIFGLATSNGHFFGTASAGDACLRTTDGGNLLFGEGTTERLRITTAGDMGLGTATPTSFGPTLQISGTDPALLLQDTATAVDYFGVNVASGAVNTWYDDAAAFTINTASGISGAGLAERLRITSDGKVGIGDASPTKALTVGTTTPVILLDDQSSRTLEIRGPSTTHSATVLTTSVHDLLLGTNNTERLRITSGGLVGINATSPAATLEVASTGTCSLNLVSDSDNNGAANDAFIAFHTNSNSGTAKVAIKYDESETNFGIETNGTRALSIDSSQRVMIGATDAGGWKLKVQVPNNSSYQSALNLTNNVNADFQFDIKSNEVRIGPSVAIPLLFKTGNTEKLSIRSNGDLILGPYDAPGSYTDTSKNVPYSIKVAPYGWANGSEIAAISMGNHSGATGNDDGEIVFKTASNVHSSTSGLQEQLRIDQIGHLVQRGFVKLSSNRRNSSSISAGTYTFGTVSDAFAGILFITGTHNNGHSTRIYIINKSTNGSGVTLVGDGNDYSPARTDVSLSGNNLQVQVHYGNKPVLHMVALRGTYTQTLAE